MSGNECLACATVVTARMHAIACDGCGRWQHRKCKSGNNNNNKIIISDFNAIS